MKEAVKVEGLRDLDKTLSQLPSATARRVLRNVLKKGAAPIVEEAKARVPVRTGELKNSIAASFQLKRGQRDSTDRRSAVEIFIGPTEGLHPPQRAIYIEFGTQPGVKGQRVTNKGAGIKQAKKGRKSYRTHPGTKPQPFMRPALDHKRDDALRIVKTELAASIDRAVKRLARKAKKPKG